MMLKSFCPKFLVIGCFFNIAVESLKSFPVQANPIHLLTQQTPNAGREVRSFFETGRLSSQDRLLFQRPPSDVIPVRSESNAWQFIIFREGNSSFWMPPGVLTQETVSLDTPLGEVNFRTLASNTDDRRYVAAYADSLTSEQLQDPLVLLTAIRDKVAPPNEFELKQERSITINDFPGRELTFENAEEIITMRVYLVNQKVYALGVRYPKSNPLPRQTRAFLNAFALLEGS
ncbi:hypothetical protein [Gloeothece citriformis]|nr:hypothetical protein [Gloeothece citriformis]